MTVTASLAIRGRNTPYTLVVEPWATEHEIHPNDKCTLVAESPNEQPSFSVEIHDENTLIVGVMNSNTTYAFHRNGVLEVDIPVPTL